MTPTPRLLCPALAAFLLIPALVAADLEKLPSFPAVAPADAVKTLRVKAGFTMDLLAAEPLVSSPVAMCYDEDGAAYVVEMLDYPYTNKATHQAYKDNTTDAPIGRVRKLVDTDGDGVFDKSYVFAEGLSWPTGICCWKGGVYVTATPDIWYLKDTNGDNVSDVREKVFTGFRKYNVQAVINNPQWTLDNRIVVAGATNGGTVTTVAHPELTPLKFLRNDLRIDPRTGKIEGIAGGARFGHGIDDWGNRFLCNIRNPAQHVVFDGTLASRNPFLPAPNPVYDVREPGDTLPVLRISPMEPWRDLRARRWTAENHAVPRSELVAGGVFTSAAGVTVYRGAAYPAEYRGQIFVCEVANNLVHRQLVAKDGVTFKVTPADADVEFVASTDIWFRPVNFINAPDGTLHVVDMYRETIEHPWSIPDDIHANLDLESGRERGRIYRLAPPNFKVPKPPRLGSATTAELVATLGNPNSWWRETAQRLLFERQDATAVPALRALVNGGGELARLHALYALDGLGALEERDILRGLADVSAGVREHAVRLAASRLAQSGELRKQVFALARDPEIRVRYQVAFAVGGVADEGAAEVELALLRQDASDRWVRAAVLGTTPDQCARLAQRVLPDAALTAGDTGRDLVRQLLFVAGAQNRPANLAAVYAAYRGNLDEIFWPALGDGLRQTGKTLRSAFAADLPAAARLGKLMTEAVTAAQSAQTSAEARAAAVRFLAYEDFATARPVLAGLLPGGGSPVVQQAAIKALASFVHADVAKTLLEPWASYTPAAREDVLAALLARRERVGALLTAIEAKVVNPGQVSATRRTQILANPDAAIKARAEKAFGQSSSGTRAEVVARYQPVLARKGDAARGAKVYDAICAACHRYAGRGTEIGPNLETIRGWDREKIMLNILDPNRQSIAKLTSSAQSLMPEGLESTIAPDAMADLLAFLTAP
ncbi:MAG: c-type cytochrome [Verrucomicrobia bacterium]|nr:c-type cytochrome [Verrucomicrobiota bacterium]